MPQHDEFDDARPTAAPGSLGRPALPVRLRAAGRRIAFACFPGLCRFCDQPTGEALDLCSTCAGDLPWLRVACRRCGLPRAIAADSCPNCADEAPRLTRTVAAFAYRPPLDRLIADIKFHGRLATAPLLASLLARVVLRAYPAAGDGGTPPEEAFPEALLPVPLSRRRLLQRGHDQAWMLAARVHDALAEAGRPVRFDGRVLRRVRHTPAQSGQRHGARLHALVGAFAVRGHPQYRHVALLDDVFTTGATLDAAAQALQAAGVARVDAWVIARTPGGARAPGTPGVLASDGSYGADGDHA